jgi:hypothetical protein
MRLHLLRRLRVALARCLLECPYSLLKALDLCKEERDQNLIAIESTP